MKIFKSIIYLFQHPLNKNWVILLLKLLLWKTNQIFFKNPIVVDLNSSVKCICYPDSSFGGLIFFTKLPDYVEMNLLIHVSKKKSIIIDVGAGIGDYSLLAGSGNKNNKVFSFEPSSKSYARLVENINLNKLSNIIASRKVISSKSEKLYFEEEDISEISHINPKIMTTNRESISIDNLCKNNNISRIDLIKIDVEGAESLVLEGMKEILSKNLITSIIIELNSNSINFLSSNKQNYKFLSKYFKCYKVHNSMVQKIKSASDIPNNETFNIICINNNKSLINFLSRYEN